MSSKNIHTGAIMKLGISFYSYYALWKRGEMDIPAFIHEAKRLGADGVELLEPLWKDKGAEIHAVEDALAATGLAVGVYSVSNNFVKEDPAERIAQIGVINTGVDSAVHFGAKVVRVFAGNTAPGIDLDRAFEWIVEGLAAAAEYAETKGIVLALENHGLLAGKSDQVKAILAAVDSPYVKANPDMGNFLLVHQASHEAVADLAGLAAMAHFKDFRHVPDDYAGFAFTGTDGVKFAGTAVGDGEVALAACLESLRDAGFTGWLNIEYEAEESPLTGVARSVENARALLAAQ
jgi:sugar phosphate isomerase/epimerase